MSKPFDQSAVLSKLSNQKLGEVLTLLEIPFDETLTKAKLVDLLIPSIPEGKMVNEAGELIETGSTPPTPPPATEEEKLKNNEVRFKENVKFNGQIYKRGDKTTVNIEEREMLMKDNLIE